MSARLGREVALYYPPVKSPVLAMYLEPFKDAAGEGAALELKMRLLAGRYPHYRTILTKETWVKSKRIIPARSNGRP
jgi:hypothetical protein